MPPLVRLRGCGRRHDTPAGPVWALRPTDLDLPAGELVAVVGRSGSGKTTLLQLLAGIDRPTEGTIEVAGTPVHALGESALARWRGRSVGVVFQFFQLLPTLTVLENVLLPMDLAGGRVGRAERERARALLDAVGVADQAGKLPAALSGGQQQRVAIARALANDPALVLADEPTGNLDRENADRVYAVLAGLVGEGRSVLVVTHEPEVRAGVHRVVRLEDGRIVGVDRVAA